ncbi:MAG: DUF1592 domain-containing protein [Verrucomicrobiota bacterium]
MKTNRAIIVGLLFAWCSTALGSEELQLSGEGVWLDEVPSEALRSRDTGEFTVAVWFTAANAKQEGPARILTWSKGSVSRNLTIGQEEDRIEVRLRSSGSNRNGTPGLQTPRSSVVPGKLTYLVATGQVGGKLKLYLDGREVASRDIRGDFSNWETDYPFGFGNEIGGSRDWTGTLSSWSWEARIWSADEISSRFSDGFLPKEERLLSENAELFETQIANLLVTHCLECHESSTAKGKLDLSKRLASHYEDELLVPGDAMASLFWESIEYDDMPHDRTPLSAAEKELVRNWIEGGASWPVEFVDPAIYSRSDEGFEPWVRRLTRAEYVATVRDVFGVQLSDSQIERIPPDVRADGFSNTAYNLTVDLDHIEAYEALAREIAAAVDPDELSKPFRENRQLTDKKMIPMIERFGAYVLRGPLTKEEVSIYRGITTLIPTVGGGFDESIRSLVQAMAQAPRFLYRIESHRGGGRSVPASNFELASRLSYFVWGSAPDRRLFELAAKGELSREKVLRAETERMLKDQRAQQQSDRFIGDWLHLDRLANLQPSESHFPNWDASLADAMEAETRAFFREIVWKDQRPLSDLLNARFTVVDRSLANHYGLENAGELGEDRFQRVSLSAESGRGGVLTQGSVLTIGGDEASMVTRGLFVLNELLRGIIQDPPPCVDTTPVDSEPGLTQRAIAMERVESRACGGCHAKFEPLAFGFERFDGLGSWAAADHHGNALREDGEILIPGDAEPIAYDSTGELLDLLAGHERVQQSLTWRIAQWAVGRPLTPGDAEAVLSAHQAAIEAGGRYQDVVTAIAMSDLLRRTRTAVAE